MEHIKLNELNLELDKLESLAYKCDELRQEIWKEYERELNKTDYVGDPLDVQKKTEQMEYYFSHVRDNARMAKMMLEIIRGDYITLRRLNE